MRWGCQLLPIPEYNSNFPETALFSAAIHGELFLRASDDVRFGDRAFCSSGSTSPQLQGRVELVLYHVVVRTQQLPMCRLQGKNFDIRVVRLEPINHFASGLF